MAPSEIAELRDFISGELQKVHIRFDGVDTRLDGLDGAVAELREKVEEVHFEQHAFQSHVAQQFGAVYARLDDVSARLSRVEVMGEEMKSDFRAFGEALQGMNRRIDEFRSDVERELRDVRAEMRGDSPPWGSV